MAAEEEKNGGAGALAAFPDGSGRLYNMENSCPQQWSGQTGRFGQNAFVSEGGAFGRNEDGNPGRIMLQCFNFPETGRNEDIIQYGRGESGGFSPGHGVLL